MTTYNCPRCGSPSSPDGCAACGRGPEPLLRRLGEVDAVLAAMPATLTSRAAVEAERLEVLANLAQVAARYHAEAEQHARAAQAASAAPAPPPTPQAPSPQPAPQTMTPQGAPPAASPAGPATAPGPVSGAMAAAGPATPPGAPAPGGAVPYPAAGLYLPPLAEPKREVGTKTVQTLLLGLGALLVAAAIIIFTAVAWRSLGDAGRAAILTLVTLLLLAVPVACKRYRLWATAETVGALGALALWCTTLAAYYLYRPPGTDFGPEAVGALTAGVLAVLAAYRGATRLSAAAWAMAPIAAVGGSFAAASGLGLAVALLLAMALALGAAAYLTGAYPGRFERSDLWASRILTCAAVVAACSAGLRAAFGLDDPVVPPAAALVAVLAAANLVGVHFARRLGVSVTTLLVAASAAGSLVLAAWVLSVRAGAPELVVPAVALLAAGMVAFLAPKTDWPLATAQAAGLAALAVFATVAFGAPDLSAYFGAFLVARLVAPLLADPFGAALRNASYMVAAGTAVAASLIALGGVWTLWDVFEPAGVFTAEVPIVLVALAFASVLLPARFRIEAAALAVSFAIVSASILVWHGDRDRFDGLPFWGFVVCGVIGLVAALASRTLAGRCFGWVAIAVWAPLAALASLASERFYPGPGWLPFWLTVTAAAMLVFAVGAPRRSRPDRVLAAVLAHVLAGVAIGVAGITDVFDSIISDRETKFFPPAQLGVYTLALAGAAMMAPVRKWGYAIAALCTGTLGWWSLLAALDSDTLEFYTAPPAAILFLIGLWRLERRPQTGSWAALALPIAGGLGPSLLVALGEDEPLRRAGVVAAAVLVVVAGLFRRWQAPIVLGAIALILAMFNELALLWDQIPKWIPLAIGGAVLIGAGATFEKRRRDFNRIRAGLKTMR